jgi:hypothetical protein
MGAAIAAFLLSVLVAGSAVAQVTSSNIRGQVTGSDGNPIQGAVVEILHVPSGRSQTAVTGETGQFFQGGLRVGGPYTITVTADDFQGSDLEQIFLQPGSQDPFRFALAADSADMDRITVVGVVQDNAIELNNGVGSSFSARDILNNPASDRDVLQTIARDPLAQSNEVGELTVAGVNPRFNGLAIDGSLQQDDFGLSDQTYATSRSPINLDIIESASLVASDYSVTQSGFTGGLVNIVTKSGSNEFDGGLYYAYQDESFIGDDFDGGTFDGGDFEEQEYGLWVSGPIVKDRLFFLLSYDEYDTSAPVDFTQADGFNGVQPGFFDAVTDVVNNIYGFDAGGRPGAIQIPETTERFLAKIDWNINDFHRASFTYQDTAETGTSVGADEFVSAWYDIPLDLEAYTGQLFSDWTDNFSTTLRINYKEFVRGQNCRAGAGVGEFRLEEWQTADLAGTPFEGLLTEDQGGDYFLGCDRFRHANEFSDDRLQIFASGDYFIGDHILTFGVEYEEYNLFNLFVSASNGVSIFTDPQSLLNRSPAEFQYQNVPSNNARDGSAEWGYERLSFFFQDRWAITPDFELSLGLRYEELSQSDAPVFSPQILENYGVRTDANLDGKDLFMPRVGFLWTPFDRTTISGGFGLFAGGNPQVWVSNAFQAPAVFVESENVTNADIFSVPQELLDQVASSTPLPIDSIAEDFDIPSDWKASLRLEQEFDMDDFFGMDWGSNYLFTMQYLYTEARDGFTWRNLSQTNLSAALPTGTAPDGRPIYADLEALDLLNLTQLGNADGAKSHVWTAALAKSFDNGFNFDVSYAYQDSEIVSPGTSSRGISNWLVLFTPDPNNPQATVSPFQTEHAFNVALGYENDFFGDLLTRFDVFGQILSGQPWSNSFDVGSRNSLFGRAGAGESPRDSEPLYIPNPGSDSFVVYGSDFDQEGFFAYVDENGIPTGRIHEPYSERSNWNDIWNLRIQQEIPGIPGLDRFIGDNNFKLILDIDNFLNLIDSDWGRFDQGPASFRSPDGRATVVDADLISVADLNALGVDNAPALTGDAPRTTCISASDCVYRFNEFTDKPMNITSPSRSIYEIRLTLRYDF